MTDKDMIIDCCNLILHNLIMLYENSEIDEVVFRDNSRIKIQFLKDNINEIEDENIKNLSLKILGYFENNNYRISFNFSSCSTQV